MEKKKWCVYIHISPSNKAYIGITSQNPKRRWGSNGVSYLQKCKNGEYKQPAMANAINKYSWNLWEHIIFADKLNKDEACRIERLLIALYDTRNSDYGYNICEGGEIYSYGLKLSEERIKQMSEAQKGKVVSEETKRKIGEANKGHLVPDHVRERLRECKSKPVVQYSLDGEFIKEWESAKSVEIKLGIDAGSIGKCCKGKVVCAGGFVWKYKGDQFYLKPYTKFKTVYQFSLNGTLIKQWDMIKTASEELGINASGIGACCNGRCKTFAGFVWSYDNNFVLSGTYKMGSKPVVQYLTDGSYSKLWITLSEAATTLNIDRYSIICCCNGKAKKTHGYKWRFATDEEVSEL